MVTAQPRRRRSRISKAAGKLQATTKYLIPSHLKAVENSQSAQLEETHNLLLSSLRYWEVERDLIEERLAAMKAASGLF